MVRKKQTAMPMERAMWQDAVDHLYKPEALAAKDALKKPGLQSYSSKGMNFANQLANRFFIS